MKRRGSGEGWTVGIIVTVVLLNLAWWIFVVWCIYQIVSWLVTK